MPTNWSDPESANRERAYQREYHRLYGRTERRRAYLTAKQREYRSRKPPKNAGKLLDYLRLQSGISISVGSLLRGRRDQHGAQG